MPQHLHPADESPPPPSAYGRTDRDPNQGARNLLWIAIATILIGAAALALLSLV